VLFCCGASYYPHLAVAMASLILNNQANRLDLHLITGAHTDEQERRVRDSLPLHPDLSLRLHNFSWEGRPQWHTSFHITREAYMRFFAPEILAPEVRRLIYLDSDLIVLNDLKPLWRKDLGGRPVAGVSDPFGASRRRTLGMPSEAPYVNSGVLLLDLDIWRAEQLCERLISYVEREGDRLLFHDQDALNAVLYRSIALLDPRWNVQAKMLRPPRSRPDLRTPAILAAVQAPAIIHYTSASKPWLFAAATPAKRLYRHYQQRTAWRGRPPDGRSISAAPAYVVNHLMYALRLDWTWDRLLRSTVIGRAIARLAQMAPRLRRSQGLSVK